VSENVIPQPEGSLGPEKAHEEPDQRHQSAQGEEEAEAASEFVDISEETGHGLAGEGQAEVTSETLYILREASYLTELDDALEGSQVDLKEEST
jgi:hypothetical protein